MRTNESLVALHIAELVKAATANQTENDNVQAINSVIDVTNNAAIDNAFGIDKRNFTFYQMQGMDRNTGKMIDGLDHLMQSVIDILSTRLNTRVMLRDYGSDVMNLIDAPINNLLKIKLFGAVAKALAEWEPRFALKKIDIFNITQDGSMDLELEGKYLGSEISFPVSL